MKYMPNQDRWNAALQFVCDHKSGTVACSVVSHQWCYHFLLALIVALVKSEFLQISEGEVRIYK